MQYEPSKELIEQIAEEVYELNKCNLGWEDEIDFVKHHKLSFQNAKNYCKLPTFNKALELYENQPKWQDKPDKEGWWWVFSLYVRGNPLIFPLYPIHILFCDGELHADTSYPEKFPSIPDYIKTLSNPMWLYIPEPHITNPTPDGGNL
ncbi:hypothetical protein ASJ33_05195 [Dehalococcoides mccartyi]|uniref:Uncharacterized protein n=1 Tax=Dehalococcoides mccartyi TaxID=61435 RepID=A0A0V8M0K1_9CHLR|nr:hypothetical protein [Dehalococcoides mccartyi]APH12589.1 hypothetical protein ASJ33_05195 [Dehalococcoides mccartyi]AQU03287.1 hypothetical protein B1773_04400 [Dehalococcoides mccartyi]KSV17315.1 hypothetical protein DA01_07775 [Dehalococcoides mccartyi]